MNGKGDKNRTRDWAAFRESYERIFKKKQHNNPTCSVCGEYAPYDDRGLRIVGQPYLVAYCEKHIPERRAQ